MRFFFKTFFATFLALVVFAVLAFFLFIGVIAGITTKERPVIPGRAVLVLDLSVHYEERADENRFSELVSNRDADLPSLYDVVRIIRYAATDSSVKGIYVRCGDNDNGHAASEEIRQALEQFRKSGKFIMAYGEAITQKGYYVGAVADKLYCHPQGGVDWSGFSADLLFLKGTLDKLGVKPQIFYAGKFKSATEPLRETKMTEANRIQTSVWLGGLYNQFLAAASQGRHIDTAQLRSLAVTGAVQTAHDAWKYGLVDGLRYDDEVKKEMAQLLKTDDRKAINFVTMADYASGASWRTNSGGRIAVIYADGDIVSGQGQDKQVGGDEFRNIIRKARLDKDIKAIVFRVNSPGGSSLASDVIWREITLARQEKPVVVSMGDMATSGGYYISCNADSVFANAGTLTGSIGVFSILPDMSGFFRDKLGVTFDGVKTAPYADMGNISRPLTDAEKRFLQSAVDSIYLTFKARVSQGRKKDIVYVDSIAQGRVWTGADALRIGLTDRTGTLQDAVECAARMARLSDYRIREYPEKQSLFEQLMRGYKKAIKKDMLENEIGMEQVKLLKELRRVKEMMAEPQARLPFSFVVE